jgi:predicted nucleotidyltransferase
MDNQISSAPILSRFRAAQTDSYGDRLQRTVSFGSRACGDFQPDYAIAVFIREPGRRFNEAVRLADLGAGILMDTGTVISAKLVSSQCLQ